MLYILECFKITPSQLLKGPHAELCIDIDNPENSGGTLY